MVMPGTWQTPRAADTRTMLAVTPLELDMVLTEHTSMVGSQDGQASRVTCTHNEQP